MLAATNLHTVYHFVRIDVVKTIVLIFEDWNILPINLTVENNQKILGGNYEPTYLEFPDKQCKLPQIIFSRKVLLNFLLLR